MSEPKSLNPMSYTRQPGEGRVSRVDHLKTWLKRQRGIVLFLIVFGVLVGAIGYHHRDVIQVSDEAVVRSGVGRDLLDGLTSGRQGLVGSLEWAPLPTILGLALVYIPVLGRTGLAWPVLIAAVSAFTVVLLNRWFRLAGIPWLIRYVILIVYQFCPPILGAVLAGSGTPLLMFFCVGGLHFLYSWLVELDLRDLAYLATFSGLAVVTDWRMSVVVLLAGLSVVMRLFWVVGKRGFAEATILIFLVPALYLSGVWVLTNWLIMGNPFFFMRGLFGGASLISIDWTGLQWHACALPLLLVSLPEVYARSCGRAGTALRAAVVLLMLAAVVTPYVIELYTERSYLEIYPQQVRTIDEIISFLEDKYPEARVLVSGYYGYQFTARAHNQELFVHCINLSLSEVDHRTRGKELFMLLPRPEGIHTWEDVHLHHPDLFAGYESYRMREGRFVAGFVFEELWPSGKGEPEWLLLRMILRELPVEESQ